MLSQAARSFFRCRFPAFFFGPSRSVRSPIDPKNSHQPAKQKSQHSSDKDSCDDGSLSSWWRGMRQIAFLVGRWPLAYHQAILKIQSNQTTKTTKKIPIRNHATMVSLRVGGGERSVNRFSFQAAVFASDNRTDFANVGSYQGDRPGRKVNAATLTLGARFKLRGFGSCDVLWPSNKAPEDVLIYLIQQTVEGSAERQLAAKFLLDCLRAHETPEAIARCNRRSSTPEPPCHCR